MAGSADPKGDIWAFGVLLHEMASGELPFRVRPRLKPAAQF